MNILSMSKMVFSHDGAWVELDRKNPPLLKLYALVVLPLSILPPAMLYHAGGYADAFVAGYAGKPWGSIAGYFFLTEILTLFVMGWMIERIAASYSVQVTTNDAYMLAGIAPIPLWLSSLALFVPSLAFNAAVSLLALAASCGLIYQGVHVLCHTHEDVTAAAITEAVMSVGMLAWAMLLVLVVGMPFA